MSTTTIIAGDVPTNWNDIFNKLLEGKHEFLVTDSQQVRAVSPGSIPATGQPGQSQ